MAKRIAMSTLNASTLDIINTIRANASSEYQNSVPEALDVSDIPKVGEVICGYPAFANQFLNALINRIALVRVNSATFNNAFADLKKGFLEFGETVAEYFVQIAKAREFSPEKAEARELKRTIPDVKSAFHTMNWRVQYPITIQESDLQRAFLSINGVQDLIAKIVNSVYTGAEYDEYLLFKYLIIKAVSHGKMFPVSVGNTPTDHAIAYRGTSNALTFMSTKYNNAGVHTVTAKDAQYIFMDSTYNAQFDVEVLARAFNMDKADFMGKLKLIDDFTTFDNERFDVVRKGDNSIEEVTPEELALMTGVTAVLVDEEWFQVYDNHARFTETYVSSGEYWNYNYNVWKTISFSPFSNAVVFAKGSAEELASPNEITVEITGKSISENATVFTLSAEADEATIGRTAINFVQTEGAVEQGIAIHPYGAVIIPATAVAYELTLEAVIGNTKYTAETTLNSANEVGATITLTKAV